MSKRHGVRTHRRCVITKRPAGTADGHRIGCTDAEETEAGFRTIADGQTTRTQCRGIAAHRDVAVFIRSRVEADRRGADPFGQALRAGGGAEVAQRIGYRAGGRGLITAGLRTNAGCRGSKAIGIGTGTQCGAADTGRGGAGFHRHTANVDQRIAVFIHCIAAHGDCARANGLRVLAERSGVLACCKCIHADRRCAIGHGIGTATECRCTVADGVGGFTGSRCVVAFRIRASIAVGTAGGGEVFGGLLAFLCNGRHIIELRFVHRIGGFSTSGDVGDLALGTFAAYRDAVGTVSHGIGAQGHAVVCRCDGGCTDSHGVGTGGLGVAGHGAIGQERTTEYQAGCGATYLQRLCLGQWRYRPSQPQDNCQRQGLQPMTVRAALVNDAPRRIGSGQLRCHHQLPQCLVPHLAINPIHRHCSLSGLGLCVARRKRHRGAE